MKKIKVDFVDFYNGFDKYKNDFIEVLRENFEVEISLDPDYIFYSCFGYEHLNYDCIRIFYTGECCTPNFNECDYAIGFDRLSFGDRYVRIPLYQLFQYKKDFYSIFERPEFTQSDLNKKKGFCNFVYSNCFAQDKRTEIFEKLGQYKRVDSGGRYRNNIGGAVKDKRRFQYNYKFSIAFENASYGGYATEKIVDAFSSRTIPIYYGDPDIALDFNEESFINCHAYKNLDEVVLKVKEINECDDLYLRMMNVPPIKKEKGEDLLKDFLMHIFLQDIEAAYRRPFSITAIKEEKMIKRHRWYEKNIHTPWSRICNQFVRLKTGTILTDKRKQ